MKKEIYILIGPGSIGKTTYLKNIGFPLSLTAFISRDDIVDRISEKYGYTYNELFLFPPADAELGSLVPGFEKYGCVIETPEVARHICPVSYSVLDNVNAEIHHTFYSEYERAVNDPNIHFIALDRVHMLKKERLVYFPYLDDKREQFYVTAVLFNFKDQDTLDIISELSERRRKEIEKTGRFKTVPREVQKRMIDRYEEVSLEEGFDSIEHVDTLPKLRELLKTTA
jgi:hypothetical protein